MNFMIEQLVKTEVHLHTAEVSACAADTAADLILACSRAGNGTVVVTDHYLLPKRNLYSSVLKEMDILSGVISIEEV